MRLIKFEQPNCGACRYLEQFLNAKGVKTDTIDVSAKPDVIEKYGIMSTPTLILLDDNGKEVDRVAGFNPSAVEELLQKAGL